MNMLGTVLEEIGNRLLRLDPDTRARLGAMQGRVIRLEFTDLQAALDLAPSAAGLRVSAAGAAPAQVTLRGTLGSFLRLGLNTEGAVLPGTIEIGGDLELGRRFERALRGLHIDWEEELARLTGDVLAHRIGNLARGARAWLRQAAGSLGRDAAEYLQEEARLLATRASVEDFLAQVDVLRADADRLEQRVRRLRQRAGA